jgi:hypothetical protein
MKKVSFCLNVATIALVIATSDSFYNDYIMFFDIFLFVSIILNFLLFRFRKFHLIKNYLIMSIIQIVYCLLTVASNIELEYQRSRLCDIFSKPEIFNSNILSFLENVSILIFVLFIILELRFIYLSIISDRKNIV